MLEALKEIAHAVFALGFYALTFYSLFIDWPEQKSPSMYRRPRAVLRHAAVPVTRFTKTATTSDHSGPPAFVADVASALVNLGYAKKLSREVALCAAGDDFESRLKRSLALYKEIKKLK